MRIRRDTWDSHIATSVLVHNEYGLPDDMSGKTVVDIGAHIGSFAIACQRRQAKKVICYEPDPENADLLESNVIEDPERRTEVIVVRKAVTGLPAKDLGLRRLTEHDFGMGRNTGHVDVFGVDDGVTGSDGINTVLGGNRIDLLKMDCEGAEWDIFEYADLSGVDEIVAELHAPPTDSTHRLLDPIKGKTLTELCDALTAKLRTQEFEPVILSTSPVTAKLLATRRKIQEVPILPEKSINTVATGRRVLWIGDACVPSGYGRVTENICTRLYKTGWDVSVLGIAYNGDPHKFPYPIYPSVDPNTGGARNGLTRIKDIMKRVKPDIVIIQDDSWNVGIVVDNMAMLNCWAPTIGYVAIDSQNVRQDAAMQMRNLKHAICHTEFGVKELVAAGYNGSTSVAGHAVDTSLYTLYNKKECRSGIHFNTDLSNAFIWGVVGRNQPRKRLDLSVAYFAAWWKRAGCPENAYLYIHADGDGSWDIRQLIDYCGIRGRVFATDGGVSLPDEQLPGLYNSFDAMISTSEGESFGLCALEGMACSVPQIAVECGGQPHWAGDAIHWVKPSYYSFTSNRTNTKRWIASEKDFIDAMDDMYQNSALRKEYINRGLQLVGRMDNWDTIVAHFDKVMKKILNVRAIASKADTDALYEF